MKRYFGPVEYGVLYPQLRGGEPNRVLFNNYSQGNTLEWAEEERNAWIARGERCKIVSRQWRVVR
jgi:hypothetical protein